jgi:class 3 adenylate cyclase/putative methionine-R-sulfoxide reductase with GAF domain
MLRTVSGVGDTSSALARRLEDALEQQRAVSSILRAVAQSAGLQPVLDEVAEAATRLCRAENAELYLAEGDLLHLFSHSGAPEIYEYNRDHPHPRDRRSIIGRVALSSETVQIPDVEADPEYSWEAVRTIGNRALLGVPILLETQLIGAIALGRRVPEPFSDEQVELVKTFADQAAIAIANVRLIEAVERQRTELARFVSPQVADLLSADHGEQLLAGHRAYVTVVFCDMRGFTSFSETAAPEELIEVLREYHRTLGTLIPRFEGTLEHFAGDGLMVFFNDPLPVEQHELKAIRFALTAQEHFTELAAGWRKRGIELGLGVGIAAGYATLGRIGFEGRYDYGALGPETNLASRLCSEAAPGQTLISQRVYAAVEDKVRAEPVGELTLKGFGRPVFAYEVRGLSEEPATD